MTIIITIIQYCKRYVKTRTKRKRNNNYYDINEDITNDEYHDVTYSEEY